jgi:DNA repair protein RadD
MKQLRPYQHNAIQECWQALKANDRPVLLMASVGSGKSLMIGHILLEMERLGKRALCVVNNAELVRNNHATFKAQGGNPSIYCAALDSKDCSGLIVFGTPQSVLNGIKRQRKIADIPFNLIVVDEAHMINHHNSRSTFMRILRHYKQQYEPMRVLGATGTDFRYKGHSIVGEDCFFKTRVGNITTAYLIEQGYLTRPTFTVEDDQIDFSGVKTNSMGQFDARQLESVIDKNTRLTAVIMRNLVQIMKAQNRFGAFVFASTIKHAYECLSNLPPDESAVITGNTPQQERMIILDKAREGKIKYLVNVAVLTVGVDVPAYDTLLFVRPTESLVLMVQMIGRVLRLAPNKESALIIDCAGNLERHSDWDDPVLLDALKQTRHKDAELIFPCYVCGQLNSEHTRRCVGIVDNKRCEHYFDFKECHECNTKNDQVARHCRYCETELIDPNAKLSMAPFVDETMIVDVLRAKYWLQERDTGFIFNASYECPNNVWFYESYTPTASEKAKNYFYGTFVKKHVNRSSGFYPHLQNLVYMRAMLNEIETPIQLKVLGKDIKAKVFPEPDTSKSPDALLQIQSPTHNNNPDLPYPA